MSNDSNNNNNTNDDVNLYFYDPSTPAAVVFTVLYFLLVLGHGYLNVVVARRRVVKHKYTIPLLVAAVVSTAGWAVRIVSIKNDQSIPLYAVSSSYIVISPIFVCAALYLLLTRLIRSSLPEEGRLQYFFGIPPHWLGRIFITSDVVSFLTQAAGSGIASSGNWEGTQKDIGTDVLLLGLSLQLATFTVFILLLTRMCYRVNAFQPGGFRPNVKRVVAGAWVAAFFVQVRSIYRVIEFALGIDGYPFTHEWCLYVLEGLPMFIALLVLGVLHPLRYMQEDADLTTSTERRGHGAEKSHNAV